MLKVNYHAGQNTYLLSPFLVAYYGMPFLLVAPLHITGIGN